MLQTANRDFYLAQEGISLMQSNFFTDDILMFHAEEEKFCSRVTNKHDYRLMIEVGCSNFRLIDAKPDECHYLGVDINPPCRTRIPEKKGAIIRCDARKFFTNSQIEDRIGRTFGNRVVSILSFNFLGTADEPLRLLDHVARWNKDIVLSLFNTTERATQARLKYYKGCRIAVEQITKSKDFVRLNCSNGFEAFAFSQDYIELTLTAFDYRLRHKVENDICVFMFFRPASDR